MNTVYKRGLFALSADPITVGHIELIRMALTQCTELVVLVANNDFKKDSYLFSLEERVQLTQRAIEQAGITKVQIIHSEGLLTDIYIQYGCDVVFRGIRHENDYIYEAELEKLYSVMLPEIRDRFVFLHTPEEYRHVSSSWVKAFVQQHVDVSGYVPLFIKQLVEEKMCEQYTIGVTGQLAVGKTWVATALINSIQSHHQNIPVHHIQIDQLLHQLYAENSAGAQRIRNALRERFGAEVLESESQGKNVNRKVLVQHLFADESGESLQWIEQLTLPHIERLYRAALHNKKGLILVEWAQCIEMQKTSWVNNNMIIVDAPERSTFVAQRTLEKEYVEHIGQTQLSTQDKIRELESCIQRDHHGAMIQHTNAANSAASIDILAQQVLELFPALLKLN